MYDYRIYGLHLRSSRKLTGLITVGEAQIPDVVVNWVGQTPQTFDMQKNWELIVSPELQRRRRVNLWQASLPEGVYLRLQFIEAVGNIEFVIDPLNRSVTVYWSSALPFSDVEAYFVGLVMACLLRQRGVLCLHASVVARNGRCIAILGKKRAGKSTTAAALVQAGWQLLADDVAAVTFDGEAFHIQAGYPRMRLAPEAVTTLYGTVECLPRVYSRQVKHYVDLDANGSPYGTFLPHSLPLTTIYILGQRSTTSFEITDMPPQKKVVSLAFNTVGNYMVIDAAMRAREFALMSQLAQRAPIRQLHLPNQLDALSQLSDIMLDDSCQESVCPH